MSSVSPFGTVSEFLFANYSKSGWVGRLFLKGYWISHMVTRFGTPPCHSWVLRLTPWDLHQDASTPATISRIIASALLETKYRGCHLSPEWISTATSCQFSLMQVRCLSWGGGGVELRGRLEKPVSSSSSF